MVRSMTPLLLVAVLIVMLSATASQDLPSPVPTTLQPPDMTTGAEPPTGSALPTWSSLGVEGTLPVAQAQAEATEGTTQLGRRVAPGAHPKPVKPPNFKNDQWDYLMCHHTGIYRDGAKQPPKDCLPGDETTSMNGLLIKAFSGKQGNSYTLWGPDDDTKEVKLPDVLKPAGYNFQLTLDSFLMSYPVYDLTNIWGRVVSNQATEQDAKTLLGHHVELLGGDRTSLATGCVRCDVNLPNCPPLDLQCNEAWMTFTVTTEKLLRQFIIFTGQLKATGYQKVLVENTTEDIFPGLGSRSIGGPLPNTFWAPKIWMEDAWRWIVAERSEMLDSVKAARLWAQMSGRSYEVYISGMSKGSGMALYTHLKLLSMAAQANADDYVPKGVYMFAAEKPGDQSLIKIYTLVDPPGLDTTRTHVWGNLEDAFLMYPPRSAQEMQPIVRAWAKTMYPWCGWFDNGDVDSSSSTGTPGFHHLPAEYWWRVVNDKPYTPGDGEPHSGWCFSGASLAKSSAGMAPDGFLQTTLQTENSYNWEVAMRWMCPWLRHASPINACQAFNCSDSYSFYDHLYIIYPLWKCAITPRALTGYDDCVHWMMDNLKYGCYNGSQA